MIQPSAEILAKLETIKLSYGSHKSAEAGMCAMEAVAWLAGEPHSDTPACASRVIGAFVIKLNDRSNDVDRQALKAYLPRILGTKGTLAQEIERGWLAADWVLRVCAPTWLELAGLPDEAQLLRSLAALTKDNASEHRKASEAARDKARNKRDENWAKVRTDAAAAADADAAADAYAAYAADAAAAAADAADAAYAAYAAYAADAYAAYAYAYAAAAYAADAAAAAAYAADAAAAAYAAAAKKKLTYSEVYDRVIAALDPTAKRVRASALDLLDRMIAVTEVQQ